MGYPLPLRTCHSCGAGSANRAALRRASLIALAVALAAMSFPGCRRLHRTDTRPLDQAGMWYNSIEELRRLGVTDAEVSELAKARQAGLPDAGCIELMRIARAHQQPFSSGDAVASLRQVGVGDDAVLELARLNQLGLWVGEAQAMRLAGLSDQIVLTVARRRAAGQPTLSGSALAKLKNSGLNEAQLLELIGRGTADEEADQIVAARSRAAGGSHFVRQYRRRR